VIVERFVTAAVPIWFGTKLIRRPNRALHRRGGILRRGRFPESEPCNFTRHNRSGTRKKIRRSGRENQGEDDGAEQDLTIDRIDKFLRVRLLQKESEEWKEKSLRNFPFHLTSSGRPAAFHLVR
jgi:hypothetical protein